VRASEFPKPVVILLAEDNPGDVRLIREVLKEGKITNEVRVVRDGVEALEYLRRQGTHHDAPRPGLLLLDLSMPRKDGREVLAEIKQDPALHRIPVVVMTSSPAEEDIAKAYDNHANCYIRKPLDFEQFTNVVRKVEHFWLAVVELPREAGN
jgi:chemotaxis family two-component system response regulator Rcp1